MALIACGECGRQISDQAASCPACGNPITRQLPGAINREAAPQPQMATPASRASEWVAGWLIAGLIVVLAFALNPSATAHRESIRAAIVDKHPIASFFGAAGLVALDVKYTSVGFASFTMSGTKTVSIGLFGQVFVLGA